MLPELAIERLLGCLVPAASRHKARNDEPCGKACS
jgi:hypothetical protein